MGLSTRELLLVLRARDEASRVINQFGRNMRGLSAEQEMAARNTIRHGQALATGGIVLAAVGVAGVNALNKMTNAAAAYNQTVALTKTQTDKVNVSTARLSQMGLDVARTLPVAFDQIQPTLYDIFSSIDTDAPGAAKLLKGIGEAAVAGNVSMDDAGRGIIGILNAYKMSANDVNKVNDVMFQLVRKGVGTYAQFDSVIGRAVPSAVKAGQSVETLAGMMAFLTRNGLSAAMASASAGRALDALSNPKTVSHFKDIGVAIYDAGGKMRPVVDIMEDLRKKMDGMTQQKKASTLYDLFKSSGGTIQAMRFFNHAINDSHDLLGELTKDMYNAKGASQDAYKVMANTPEAKVKLLSNQYHAMQITIGNQLLPAKMRLIAALSKLLGWFTSLNPKTQSLIVRFVAFASVGAILLGVVLAVVGSFMVLSGALALAGTSILAVVATIGVVLAVMAALAAAGYLVYKNWGTIAPFMKKTWDQVYNAVAPTVEKIVGNLRKAWGAVVPWAIQQWNALYKGVRGPVIQIWHAIQEMIGNIKAHLAEWGPMLKPVEEAMRHIGNFIDGTFRDVIWPVFKFFADVLLKDVVSTVQYAAPVVIAIFKALGNIIGDLLDIFRHFIMIFVDLINGDWKKALNEMLHLEEAIFSLIGDAFKGLWHIVVAAVKGLVQEVISWFKNLYEVIVGHSIVPDLINAIVAWFIGLPAKVIKAIAQMVTSVITTFFNFNVQLSNKMAEIVGNVVHWFAGLVGRVLRALGLDRVVSEFAGLGSKIIGALSNIDLFSAGAHIVGGLVNGIQSMMGQATKGAADIGHGIANAAKSALQVKSPSKVFYNIGLNVVQGLTNGLMSGSVATSSFENRISTFIGKAKQYGKWALAAGLIRETKELVSLVKLRESVTKRLTAAQTKLDSLRKSWTDTRTGIYNNIMSSFDISQAYDITDATNLLQNKLTQAKQFINNLAKLKKLGLNQNEIANLAAQGPDAVGDQVAGLAKGSKAQIAKFNKLYGQLNAVATSGSRQIADSLYASGIRAAEGLVAGLRKQLPSIQKVMNSVANTMIKAIKAALGIKSPSKVFHSIGQQIVKGLINGMMSGKGDVSDSVNALVPTGMAASGASNNNSPVSPSQFGSPKQVIFQAGSVVTQEIDPIKHAADLGWEVSRRVS